MNRWVDPFANRLSISGRKVSNLLLPGPLGRPSVMPCSFLKRKASIFGATFSGTVADAGKQLYHCAVQAGFGKGTQLHAVGDGATWIADQIDEHFGAQGSYLIDFYHICDY